MSRIAIVGSGVAGLTAAWHLHRQHDIVLFEANDYVGGHTATVDVEYEGHRYAIDTGFIVFNDWTYPNFITLLEDIDVRWQHSNMSFSLRCEQTGLEYNGTSLNSLFAQRRNLINPPFLRMLLDILRFNSRSRALLNDARFEDLTLGDYLRAGHYSRAFIDRYIIPMGRAIWSATGSGMLEFPARFFVDFFDRHGFLNVNDRPTWRTICGGSREYVRKLIQPFTEKIRLNAPVRAVTRLNDGGVRVGSDGPAGQTDECFDQIFFACHSDQALAMLTDATAVERDILGAFPYQLNDATLHTDERVLPRTPLARAAWNYHLLDPDTERVALTYDMNVLQSIEAPVKFLVTLNREADIDPRQILGRYRYHHPVYTPAAVRAQKRREELNRGSSFFCGAYWRYGFHEDGVVSALWALADHAAVHGLTPPAAPRLAPTRRSLTHPDAP